MEYLTSKEVIFYIQNLKKKKIKFLKNFSFSKNYFNFIKRFIYLMIKLKNELIYILIYLNNSLFFLLFLRMI
jgi:hypothetical protein